MCNLKLSEEINQTIVKSVFASAEDILSNTLFPHFSDHSIKHSIQVVQLASSLIATERISLSEDEKFVLLCAIALHDIGMQTAIYLKDSSFPLTNEKLQLIRQNHHIYSFKFIVENSSCLGLQKKDGLVDYIAQVAKNHRQTDLSIVNDTYIVGIKLRLRLLSLIIRLCDCLDCDFKRVDISKLLQFNIEIQSKAFWFCHYYVQSVRIERGIIKIVFRFPANYKNSNLPDIVKNYVISQIKEQISELYDLFFKYDVVLHRDLVDSSSEYIEALTKMPEDVEKFIRKSFTLGKEEAFTFFSKRSEAINKIIDSLGESNCNSSFLCFFGGISTRLCNKETVAIFSSWLKLHPDSLLFMCYETGVAATRRSQTLANPLPASDGLPDDPKQRMRAKIKRIRASQDLYPTDVRERVFFIPLSTPLHHYTIILDDNIFWSPLTEQRSSNVTTTQAKNDPNSIKAQHDYLQSMSNVLSKNKKGKHENVLIERISLMLAKIDLPK